MIRKLEILEAYKIYIAFLKFLYPKKKKTLKNKNKSKNTKDITK